MEIKSAAQNQSEYGVKVDLTKTVVGVFHPQFEEQKQNEITRQYEEDKQAEFNDEQPAKTVGTIKLCGIMIGTYDGGWDNYDTFIFEYNEVTFSKCNSMFRAIHVEIPPEFCRAVVDYENGKIDIYDTRKGLDGDMQRSFYTESIMFEELESENLPAEVDNLE